MKQLLTFVLFVIVSLSASAQKRIDYDYEKYFIADYVWIDYNQNEDIDAGEQYKTSGNNASCTVSFSYKVSVVLATGLNSGIFARLVRLAGII